MSANETPLILSIETATRAGSVAITRGHALLAERTGDAAISHSSLLLSYISDALKEAGVKLAEIEFFAAAIGPGSFTGLRIGLATIKSFAATLSRPCLGIPTLHAIAQGAGESEQTLSLLPAGRGEVYVQRLKVKSSGEVYPLDAPSHQSPQKLLERVKTEPRLIWAGDGVNLHKEAIRAQAISQGITFVDESQTGALEQAGERLWRVASAPASLATSVARLALLRARSADVETPEQMRAIYVRPSDAELNEPNREEK